MNSNSVIFSACTIKADRLANKIISDITVSLPHNPNNNESSPTNYHQTKALWDTGATHSVITKKTAEILNLTPIGQIEVQHAGGKDPANTYVVDFLLPNNVKILNIFVSECPRLSDNVGAIVGMDIIILGDFSITNTDGKTWMSYRIPSIEQIDYVKLANKIKFAGIGRNDPCPCGKVDSSGKPMKFKKCCGKSNP
jgi:predicted aspartyl protease